MLALSNPGTSIFAQCSIEPQTIARQSADDLNIHVQGTCSRDCHQITVHWVNPPLPDKTVSVNLNLDDPTQPSTWSVPYGSADGLTLTMLLNNFPCGSTNFSVEISCADVTGCPATPPAGGLKVACKQGDAVCSIQDIDLHCGANGRLTAETSVSSTGSESVSVTLAVTKDGQNVASRSFSDNDGFVTISEDFDFAAGTYAVTTSVTAPALQTRSLPTRSEPSRSSCVLWMSRCFRCPGSPSAPPTTVRESSFQR
jgi:hypothetical protein